MYISIGELSLILGVAVVTLRRWDRSDKLKPTFKTIGLHRRHDLNDVKKVLGIKLDETKNKLSVGYARVSSSDQKKDLITQADDLSEHIKSHNETPFIIKDLGSGLNYKKRGLKILISLIVSQKVYKITSHIKIGLSDLDLN